MSRTSALVAVIMPVLILSLLALSSSRGEERSPAADKSVREVSAGGYTLVGPYTHENLTVYLVRNPDAKPAAKKYLTLQEALDQKKAVVNETHSVNQLTLAIAGGEDQDVFIQSGDIVKGGDQDRTLGEDYILSKAMGESPIASFCVEHGRWTKRGAEANDTFACSSYMVVGKQMKLAANVASTQASQSRVWEYVAQAQTKLSENAAVKVAAEASPSSLQLALENKDLEQRIDEYVNALTKIVDEHPDAAGMAFAINGKMNSADVYCDAALFKAMWPKLLKSAATEAFAELKKDHETATATAAAAAAAEPGADEIGGCFAAGKTDPVPQWIPSQTPVSPRTRNVRRETPTAVMFETIDTATQQWVHRSYLTKDVTNRWDAPATQPAAQQQAAPANAPAEQPLLPPD